MSRLKIQGRTGPEGAKGVKGARGARAALRDGAIACGASALFSARAQDLSLDLPPSLTARLEGFNDWEWVDRELALMDEAGVRLITITDPDYPACLKEIPDPPLFLYAKGGLSLAGYSEALAIVGTRRPTHYGLRMAERIGADMASLGALIVSGMARGCDMAAHKGALGAGGATVAVLGTGVDRCYPPEARRVYDEIAGKGLLLSELPMGTGPLPYNFPRRNRIISGLSRGVLVVEAPLRSGAMMTSRLALEHNRDVFAVPGPASSYKSRGPNSLIKQGAVLVEEAGDILSSWGLRPTIDGGEEEEGPGPSGAEEALVFKALEGGPLSIDAVAAATGIPIKDLGGLLLEMELKGLVAQRPGKVFVRKF